MARYLGRWIRHSGWYPDRKVRLYHRQKAKWMGDFVHESVHVSGRVGHLESNILHFTCDSLSEHLKTLDRYTTLAAQELAARRTPVPLFRLILDPAWTFLRSYFLQRGFLDADAARREDVCAVLDDAAREAVARAGIVIGPVVVFVPAGLTPDAIAARVALATAWYGAGRALRPPTGGAVSFHAGRGIDPAAYAAIGFPVFGPRAIRADVAARVGRRLAGAIAADASGPAAAADASDANAPDAHPADAEIASWLGCTTREVRRIVEALCAVSG